MTVAHDHGYCYLQTKDVSGAAFDGASDGGVVSSTRTDQNVKQGEGSIKTGGKLHPAALSPADVALFPTSPGAAEGSEMGNPTPSDPQAEGHPGNSLRGLPARPAALY